MSKSENATENATYYTMGAITQFTGLNAHTVRVWERRYKGLEVKRAENGRRLYTEQDMRRLAMMKKLTDYGHRISDLVNQSAEQLEGTLAFYSTKSVQQVSEAKKTKLAVWGKTLPSLIESDAGINETAKIVACTTELVVLREALHTGKVDSLVLEFDTIQTQDLQMIRDLNFLSPNSQLTVIFHFAHREIIAELRKLQASILRAPIETVQLLESLQLTSQPANDDRELMKPINEAPEHVFSRKQLNQIAAQQTTVDCECPYHLVNLIIAMSAFESYSQQCEIRSEEDAVLHNEVYKTTAQSRYAMEQMLSKVLRAEGLRLPH